RIDAVGLHMGPLGEHGPGGNDRIALHQAIVHDDAPHPYQHIVPYGTAVHNGIVADRDIIADLGRGFLIGAMDHGPVLYIDLVAHFDVVDIPADHGVEPDRTLVPHAYLLHDGGVFGNITILSNLVGSSPDLQYGHNDKFYIVV